jgi:hypothetical protein
MLFSGKTASNILGSPILATLEVVAAWNGPAPGLDDTFGRGDIAAEVVGFPILEMTGTR